MKEQDKSLIVYPGLLHELYFEKEPHRTKIIETAVNYVYKKATGTDVDTDNEQIVAISVVQDATAVESVTL